MSKTKNSNTDVAVTDIPAEQFDRIVVAAVHALFYARLHSCKPFVSAYTVERDGRKRRKIARQLMEMGFFAPESKAVTAQLTNFTATDAALAEFTSVKPDLVAILKTKPVVLDDISKCRSFYAHGVGIDDLHTNNLVYILANPEKFSFCYANRTQHKPLVFGSKDNYSHQVWNGVVCIADAAYTAFVEQLHFEQRVNESMIHNVAWGLRNVVGCSKEDTEYVSSGTCHVRFGGVDVDGPYFTLGDEWSVTVDESVSRLTKAIAQATRCVEALTRISLQVAHYGGWQKFREDFAVRIAEELRKDDATDEELVTKAST